MCHYYTINQSKDHGKEISRMAIWQQSYIFIFIAKALYSAICSTNLYYNLIGFIMDVSSSNLYQKEFVLIYTTEPQNVFEAPCLYVTETSQRYFQKQYYILISIINPLLAILRMWLPAN